MAKIVSQDPNTGFVTLQLDDGRTTYVPADVAYRAFPDVRDPVAEAAQSLEENGLAQPQAAPAPVPSPVPDIPLPSGPGEVAPAAPIVPPVEMADPTLNDLPVIDDELRQGRPGPADQTSFASPYGQRTPNGEFGAARSGGRTHTGVDYVAKAGDPIVALGPGTISVDQPPGQSVGDGGKGGLRVWVDYDNGHRSASMHMSRIDVKPGQRVDAGTVLGAAGNTGTSSGPHEHRVYVLPDGRRVNEEEFRASFGGSGKFSLNTNLADITGPPGAQLAPAGAGFNALGSQMAQATADKRQALLAEAGVKTQMAPFEEQAALEQEDLFRRERGRRLLAQDQIQARLAEEDSRIQSALDAIPQVDPKRFWNDKSNFDKTMGAFAAGLAGFLNPGGKNVVVETAQQLIQDDLRAQETNIQTARQRVGALENRYNRVAGRLEQDELAKRELALYKLETIKAGLAAKMASFKSPLTQAEYAGALAELNSLSVKNRAELLGMMDQHMLAQSNFELDRWYKNEQVKLEKGRLGLSVAEAEAKAAAGKGAIGKTAVIGKSTGLTINGNDVIAPGADEKLAAAAAEDYQKRGLAANDVWRAAEYLKSLKKDFISAKVKPDKAKIAQAAAMLETAIAAMTETSIARASDRDMQRIKDAAGSNVTSFVALMDSDIFDEMVQTMQTNTVTSMNEFAQKAGPQSSVTGEVGDIQWNPPQITEEWEAGRENPVKLEREISQMRPGGPKVRQLEPNTGVIPKEPKKGQDQADYVRSKQAAKNTFTEETANAALAKANALVNAVHEGRTGPGTAVVYAKQLVELGQELKKAGFKSQAGQMYSMAASLMTFEPQAQLDKKAKEIESNKRGKELLDTMTEGFY